MSLHSLTLKTTLLLTTSSTLLHIGIIAREYEVTSLAAITNNVTGSPYNTLIESIIDNMNLSNREELTARLQEAAQQSQPTPEQQQLAQAAQQAQLAFQQSQTAALTDKPLSHKPERRRWL